MRNSFRVTCFPLFSSSSSPPPATTLVPFPSLPETFHLRDPPLAIDTVATLADPNELFLPGDRQNNLAMSSVPLLRTPVPSPQRNNGTPGAPKLTLGIPPSPNVKPVNGNGIPVLSDPAQPLPAPSRPALRPALRLATPMLTPNAPQPTSTNGRPTPPNLTLPTGGLGINSQPTLNGSGPSSASTADMARNGSDPSSAISSFNSDNEGSSQLEGEDGVDGALAVDFEKMSLEKGRPLDVEDLDDKGWHAASEQKKIIELGSLGEGAGGAVTRCKLKDGNTVFALKVGVSRFSDWNSFCFHPLLICFALR